MSPACGSILKDGGHFEKSDARRPIERHHPIRLNYDRQSMRLGGVNAALVLDTIFAPDRRKLRLGKAASLYSVMLLKFP